MAHSSVKGQEKQGQIAKIYTYSNNKWEGATNKRKIKCVEGKRKKCIKEEGVIQLVKDQIR